MGVASTINLVGCEGDDTGPADMLSILRRGDMGLPPAESLDNAVLDMPNVPETAIQTWVEWLCLQGLEERSAALRVAVDLDDTILHGSETCRNLWDIGEGYKDPAIASGYRYSDLKVSWRGRTHLLRGRPRYDAVDRVAHPWFTAPRVVVAPNVPLLSVLQYMKGRGVRLALATTSARQRVEYLFVRLPVLKELFGKVVFAAEDLAARAVEAAEGPEATPVWEMSAAVHVARPFSLATKTPWALAPAFGDEPYDLLLDDSELTTDLLRCHGLGGRLLKVDGQAFHPEKAWGTAADFLARIAGRTLSAEERAAAVRLAPPVEVLRFEDPLYLPLMHVTDQFRLGGAYG